MNFVENLEENKRLFVLMPGLRRYPNILNILDNSSLTSFSRTLTGEQKLTPIQQPRYSREVHVHQIAEMLNFNQYNSSLISLNTTTQLKLAYKYQQNHVINYVNKIAETEEIKVCHEGYHYQFAFRLCLE